MRRTTLLFAALAAAALPLACPLLAAEPSQQPVWPGTPPDPNPVTGPEADTTTPTMGLTGGRRVTRIGNVSIPTYTVYSPEKPNGAAVIVCPGGGYRVVSLDLEGSEVCQWFNSIGVTAILLKYRVPDVGRYPQAKAPLDDAQRCMGIVRQHAAEWRIDPSRVGVLGFSAGGHLAAALCTHWRSRIYARVDAADDLSCRPDFAFIIYPGYMLDPSKPGAMNPDVPVDKETPQAFVSVAEDDYAHSEGTIAYALACVKAHVPVELHVYPVGGHGYGMREVAGHPITRWGELAAQWMAARHLLSP